MSLVLGCIADDFTGATDLAAMLSRGGLRVRIVLGVPGGLAADAVDGADAVVVALKSRSLPSNEAVQQSLASLTWLRGAGASRFFFKYCSTFDSTDRGNIGPVAVALADALRAERVLFCPAFPENGRTVYAGSLFVHGVPLNESGMAHHPINPMTDANLLRVLGRQTDEPIGLIPYAAVDAGAESILSASRDQGGRLQIADTLSDEHLDALAEAVADDVLVTGGSAIARPLAEAYRRLGRIESSADGRVPVSLAGPSAIIAGSCSEATRRQVAVAQARWPSLRVDPLAIADGTQRAESVVAWAVDRKSPDPVLLYSSADPDAVAAAHGRLGREAASTLVEEFLGSVAAELVQRGVGRLVVAGGETAGAVLSALGTRVLAVGAEIEPGVPWVTATDPPRVALALKSGNFGSDRFFTVALEAAA